MHRGCTEDAQRMRSFPMDLAAVQSYAIVMGHAIVVPLRDDRISVSSKGVRVESFHRRGLSSETPCAIFRW